MKGRNEIKGKRGVMVFERFKHDCNLKGTSRGGRKLKVPGPKRDRKSGP